VECIFIVDTSFADRLNKLKIERVKELSSNFQFYSNETISKLPIFISKESVMWMDDKVIKERKMERNVVEVDLAMRNVIKWIKIVVKERWIPEDIERRFLALRESLEGDDAIWTRYQCEEYAIQIVVSYGVIVFSVKSIKDNNGSVLIDDESKVKSFIAKSVDRFLNKSDEINKLLTDEKKKMLTEIVIGDGVAYIDSKTFSNLWWEWLEWCTDGKTITFWIPKTDERTAIEQPTRVKHWFSKEGNK